MPETMEEVKVIVPCPSCARPMVVIGDSWQCLACHPIPEDIPTCATQKCQKPLTKLGDPWNCWICLKCNDHPEVVNKKTKEAAEQQEKRKYVGQTVSMEAFEKLQGQIAELLARPSYPPPQAEINQIAETVGVSGGETVFKAGDGVVTVKPETYMQKAKRLGVATHIPTGGLRKKAEVLVDIAAKETTNKVFKDDYANPNKVPLTKAEENIVDKGTKEMAKLMAEKEKAQTPPGEDDTFREASQTPPGEDTEIARGLTAEDMM